MRQTALVALFLLLAGCSQTPTESPNEPPVDIAARLAVLQDAWFCQQDVEVDDLNTTAVGGLTCRVSVEVNAKRAEVYSTGIPNHDFESGPGCCATERAYTWRIPLEPTPDTDGELEVPPARGPIAVALNGVPIYGPEDGPGGDAVAHHHGQYEDDRQAIWLGICHGHSAGTQFHYHADASCMYWSPGPGQSWSQYSWDLPANKVPYLLLGFAFDGYPIYGPYAQEDDQLIELRSSYQLKDGATGYNGIADYQFVNGLGDLDKCNGRIAPTPEFPGGTYHYIATRHNGNGELGFPYFINCYHGQPETTNYAIVPGTEDVVGQPGQPGRPGGR